MNLAKALTKIPAAIGYPLGSFVRGVQAGLTGRWEGSEATRVRNRPPRALESQDWGLNYGVREGLLSEARALAQTEAVVKKVDRLFANHVVCSCRMKWHTGDPVIDQAYHDGWEAWMRMADRGGRHHFRKLTKIAVESVVRDGGILGQFDRRGGFLQIAGIEYDRISSAGIFNADQPGLVGGFLLDGNGREIGARVWERTLYGTFWNPQEIPKSQYTHVFDSDRIDSVKGVTAYHAVLNSIRDKRETVNAELLAAKRNSKLALLVKTVAGGAAAPAVDLFQETSTRADGSGTATTQTVTTARVGDAAEAYMFPNEDIKAHSSERPSAGWQWLVENAIREIAAGLDLPFGVVWHMVGLGGPAVRFELGQANRVFSAFCQDILEPMWFRPIVGAWITMEIANGRLPFHPNWFKFKTPRPKDITIDLGRDSKSGIAENTAGLMTATDWYADEDKVFEDETDRLGYEAQQRRIVAEKYKVPVEEIRALGQVTTKIQQNDDPDDTAPKDEQPQPVKITRKG